jgi:RNA polymerase sigma-70 factor (ECF subfamily)
MLQVHMSTPEPSAAPLYAVTAQAVGDETAALMPVIRAVAASVLGESRDHPDVLDCAQDVLRRALEGRSRLRPGEPLRPWVLGIARHVAIDFARQRNRARVRTGWQSARGGDDDERLEVVDTIADPEIGPEEQVARMQRDQKIRAAIDKLSEGQRSAMVLFHVDGLGYQEVSERLGVPLGTVATWISRGRRSVATALGETENKS